MKKDIEAKMYGMEAKMDGLNKGIEAKIDDMEAKMDGMEAKVNDLKKGMEDLKIDLKTDLTKFLQEMLTSGERVVKETHDEKEINVNHDFIDSNVGSKNHHVPKIDMRKFDGKDHGTWILQMEQFSIYIMCKTHKRYALQLYIWNQISVYGIDGFALINKLSRGLFL